MTEDSQSNDFSPTTPNPGDSPFDDSKAQPDDRRPHPLDEDESWKPPPQEYFTPRNLIAMAVTLTISLMLAFIVGLPYSPAAMVGVFAATCLILGPLWFVMAHQRYDDRFERWKSALPKGSRKNKNQQGSHIGGESELGDAPAGDALAEPILAEAVILGKATAESLQPPGPLSGGRSSQLPSEPIPSYYHPVRRLDTETQSDSTVVAARVYPLIALFSVFLMAILIASPFLAAALVWSWG